MGCCRRHHKSKERLAKLYSSSFSAGRGTLAWFGREACDVGYVVRVEI
jgi:hypothetical protein